jgi:hypothetical protein
MACKVEPMLKKTILGDPARLSALMAAFQLGEDDVAALRDATTAVGSCHAYSHGTDCRILRSSASLPATGMSDGESAERLNARLAKLVARLVQASPASTCTDDGSAADARCIARALVFVMRPGACTASTSHPGLLRPPSGPHLAQPARAVRNFLLSNFVSSTNEEAIHELPMTLLTGYFTAHLEGEAAYSLMSSLVVACGMPLLPPTGHVPEATTRMLESWEAELQRIAREGASHTCRCCRRCCRVSLPRPALCHPAW